MTADPVTLIWCAAALAGAIYAVRKARFDPDGGGYCLKSHEHPPCLYCGAPECPDRGCGTEHDTAHQWYTTQFCGNLVCDRCRLLPLDQDDIDTDCPGQRR